jgi:hypothetical protein
MNRLKGCAPLSFRIGGKPSHNMVDIHTLFDWARQVKSTVNGIWIAWRMAATALQQKWGPGAAFPFWVRTPDGVFCGAYGSQFSGGMWEYAQSRWAGSRIRVIGEGESRDETGRDAD